MRYLHITSAVCGLLFVLVLGSGCSSSVSDLVSPTSDFWDRSPCVAGVRQSTPCDPPPQAFVQRQSLADCGCPAPAPESFPPAEPYREPPAYRTAPEPAPRVVPYEPAESAPPPRPRAEAPRMAVRSATPDTRPSPAHAPASVEEMQALDYVNRIRTQHSLRPLRYQARLWQAAHDHSREQKQHGYMGHGSPDPERRELAQRMVQAGYHGRVFAEVVAWGYPDVPSVVEGWMNSPDHRRILLDPDLSEGAFSRVDAYWTGNFGAPARYGPVSAPRGRADASSLRYTSREPVTFRRAPAPAPSAGTFRRAPAPAPRSESFRRAPAPRASTFQRTPSPVPPAPVPRAAPPKAAPALPSLQPPTSFG